MENWDTSELDNAATRWRQVADHSEQSFDQHQANIVNTDWSGDAKDAATDSAAAAVGVAGNQNRIIRESASIAENGCADVKFALRAALSAIAEAEADGFTVGEDLSLTDTRYASGLLRVPADRGRVAAEHADNVKWSAQQLVQTDSLIANRLKANATELDAIHFAGQGPGATVQAASFKTAVDIDGDGKDDTEKLAEAFLYGQGQVRGSDGQLIPMTPERIMAALNLSYDTKYNVPENFLSNFNAAAVGGGNLDEETRTTWTKAIVKSAMDSGIPPEILAAQIDEETGGTWDPTLWTGFGEHPYYNPDGTRSNDDGRGLGQFTSGTWNSLMPDHPITNFDADASTPNLEAVDPRTIPELALEAQGRYDRQVLGAILDDPRTAALGLSDTTLMLDGYNGGASYEGVLNAEANNPEYGGYASKILTEHVPRFQIDPSIPPPRLGTM